MPRPQTYSSAADRQAAYRARQQSTTTRVNRNALDQLHLQLDALQNAVRHAAAHGHPLALACRAASTTSLLDKLIHQFEKVQKEVPAKME